MLLVCLCWAKRIFYLEKSMHTVLFTRSPIPLQSYMSFCALKTHNNTLKCVKACRRMSSTTTKKAHPLSPRRRWAQWRFQHPNETRSILLWLVILDSWLVGLRAPLSDFQDLRSSVQPFAAGSTLPLWPAWQNSQKELGKVVFPHPVRPFSFFFLCCTGPFVVWAAGLLGKSQIAM